MDGQTDQMTLKTVFTHSAAGVKKTTT